MDDIRVFLETKGLYAWNQLAEQECYKTYIPLPKAITVECSLCGKPTTFTLCEHPTAKSFTALRATGGGKQGSNLELGLNYIEYRCADCKRGNYIYLVELFAEALEENKELTKLLAKKYGQYPEPPIEIDKKYASLLDSDVQYYKRSLICRNHGYGLAAISYLRRVIENKINNLIDILISDSDEPNCSRLRDIKRYETLDKKLDETKELIPEYLIHEGHNPVKLLYELFCIGLHGKNEQECLEIYDAASGAFELTFKKLQEHTEEIKHLKRGVKILSKFKDGIKPK